MVIGLRVVPVSEIGIKRRLMLSLAGFALEGVCGVKVKMQVESCVWRKICAACNGLGFISMCTVVDLLSRRVYPGRVYGAQQERGLRIKPRGTSAFKERQKKSNPQS